MRKMIMPSGQYVADIIYIYKHLMLWRVFARPQFQVLQLRELLGIDFTSKIYPYEKAHWRRIPEGRGQGIP